MIKSVLISGGGTGGHIFPAVAIADEIKSRYPGCNIVFVGAKGKMEMEKVPAAGYRIHGLWIEGIQRRQLWKNVLFPFKLGWSLIRSFGLIRKYKPEVVIGVGGFASGPLLYAATFSGVKTLIQEQNNYPGITNRLLGKRVDTVCTGFSGLERFFPGKKLVVTGNPVRTEIRHAPDPVTSRKSLGLEEGFPTLLITGGSLGARSVNEAIETGMDRLNKAGVQVIWQTGKSYTGNTEPEKGLRTVFIERMDEAYSVADLVIARAGALTIAELAVMGKPAILVPLPTAAEDHQTANARGMVDSGAALLVADRDVEEQLVETALATIGSLGKLTDMSRKALDLAKPQAVQTIVDEVENLVK
jgi:UDP-N-acetylglucosamine--N-acetylmuramyl-(pentapeptide) pyrophosphoryl-undecaprenol N-acetylglucosamine transferase